MAAIRLAGLAMPLPAMSSPCVIEGEAHNQQTSVTLTPRSMSSLQRDQCLVMIHADRSVVAVAAAVNIVSGDHGPETSMPALRKAAMAGHDDWFSVAQRPARRRVG